jgi:nitrogen regulatory protein PII
LQLEEIAVVDRLVDQLLDVVRLVRVVGDERVERVVDAVGRVLRRPVGGFWRLLPG